MQVFEEISCQYRNGPKVAIPAGLIHVDADGHKWLRMRASNATLARLLLGHFEEFQSLKNPSLTASPQWKKLLTLVRDEMKKQILNKDAGQADLFADDDTGGDPSDDQKHVRKKLVLAQCPPRIQIPLLGLPIWVKTPKSWKESDVVIPLDAISLGTVCDFIMEDVDACLKQEKKRSYNKTGNYSKRAKKQDTVEEQDD